MRRSPSTLCTPEPEAEETLDADLSSCERRYIENTPEANAGRVTATATRLGISRCVLPCA